MTQSVMTAGLVLVGAACVVAAAPRNQPPAAPETEVRTFAVKVDGKAAGTWTMTARTEGATATVTTAADVLVRKGPFKYTYALRSTETWKDGKLAAVDATANDDGKRHAVRVAAAADGLTVTAGGRTRAAKAAAITTTGWKGPDPAARDAVLLDTEDGTETAVQVQSLGACRVVANGQTIDGQKYRLTGTGVDSEWWFDAAGRPIHQRMTWDGHKVEIELVRVAK